LRLSSGEAVSGAAGAPTGCGLGPAAVKGRRTAASCRGGGGEGRGTERRGLDVRSGAAMGVKSGEGF
jgi:hypothetical protein